MCSATIYSIGPSLAKLDSLVSETEGSGISRTLGKSSKTMMDDTDDRRIPLVCYLENPDRITDRKV
jgi:hypothetical protein